MKQPREKANHEKFMRRTYSIHKHQVERATEKGGALDYGLEQIRGHVKAILNLKAKCPLCCEQTLTPKNFSLDHKTPIERGGSFAWDNIRVVCDACNRAKGRMSEWEFCALLNFLAEQMPPEMTRDILGRLKAGAAVVRLRFVGKRG